jgi:hypothetical protein
VAWDLRIIGEDSDNYYLEVNPIQLARLLAMGIRDRFDDDEIFGVL